VLLRLPLFLPVLLTGLLCAGLSRDRAVLPPSLNRLTNVIDLRLVTASKNTAYAYDGVGNLAAVSYRPNGVTNLYQYDAQNRLTNLVWKLNAGTLAGFGYTLNAVGGRTQLLQSLGTQPTTFAWGYDPLQRLTSETVSGGSPSGTVSYTHDLVGNRKTRSTALGLSAQTLNYDVNDWLDNDTVTNNASFYFDAAGQTRTNVWDGAARQYGYDWAGRLTAFTNGAAVVTLTSDADGNRIKKTVGGTTTWFLVATVNPSGWPQVIEEHAGASPGTLSRRYTYGLDLISQTAGGATRFFGTDGLGSTRFLLHDTTGAVTEHYGYDAFGTIIVSNAAPSTACLFAGEQWDADLGLYYNRARYLHPGLGRFWTLDTFEGQQTDPLSLHKYLYASGNPVMNTDPTGQYSFGQVLGGIGIASTIASIVIPAITSGGDPGVILDASIDAIPVYGNAVSAIENFQTGHPIAGAFDVAFTVADAFGGKVLGLAKARKFKKIIPGKRGVVTVGDSSELARNLGGVADGFQAHHLIPSAVAQRSRLLQKVGIDLNHKYNGIALPVERHSGFHSAYSDVVERVLNNIEARNLPLVDAEGLVLKLQLRLRAALLEGFPLYKKEGVTADDWVNLLSSGL
jgi:RHS repeat-associated protein